MTRMPSSPLGGILSIRSMAKAIAAVATAICLAVLAAGGTYALLNSSVSTASAATITSGTAALAVAPVTMSTAALYPGFTTFGTATVTNTGDVPLSMRITGLTQPATSTAFSQSLTIGVGIAATAAACTSGIVTPVWTGSFAVASMATIGPSLAAHSSAIFCVSVAMPLTAVSGSQGQAAANFGLLIDGTQA